MEETNITVALVGGAVAVMMAAAGLLRAWEHRIDRKGNGGGISKDTLKLAVKEGMSEGLQPLLEELKRSGQQDREDHHLLMEELRRIELTQTELEAFEKGRRRGIDEEKMRQRGGT